MNHRLLLILPLLVLGLVDFALGQTEIQRNGRCFIVSPDGTSDEGYTGEARWLWKDSELASEISNWKNGYRHGLSRFYHENGELRVKGSYKDGKRDGPVELYYPKGQLKRKETYKDGNRHGPFERYLKNGKLWEKATHKDGKLVE